MAQTKNATPAAPAAPSTLKTVIGYGIGAALGLALLLVLQRMLTTPPPRVVDELPHLAILAEFDDVSRPEVRQQLCDLHRELVKLELAVQGPLSFPVMVTREEGVSTLADLDKLTPEQVKDQARYFGVAGYLVPRLLSSDGRSAILRAAPAGGGGFLPGTRARVEQLLQDGRWRDLKLAAYSHALRLDDPDVRARINATFGVQTAIVYVDSAEKVAGGAEVQRTLLKIAERLRRDPRVRAVTVDGSFIHYAAAVEARNPELAAEAISSQTWERLQADGRRANVPSATKPDGSFTQIDVATDQESTANRELCYALATMASNPTVEGLNFKVRRVRGR